MRVLKFAASWCGPCKALTEIIKNAGDKVSVSIEEIDIDSASDVAMEYGVRSVPTMIVLDDNNTVLRRKVGIVGETELLNFLRG